MVGLYILLERESIVTSIRFTYISSAEVQPLSVWTLILLQGPGYKENSESYSESSVEVMPHSFILMILAHPKRNRTFHVLRPPSGLNVSPDPRRRVNNLSWTEN